MENWHSAEYFKTQKKKAWEFLIHYAIVQLTFKIQLPRKKPLHIPLAISLYPVVTLFAPFAMAPDNFLSNGKAISLFRCPGKTHLCNLPC